MLLQTTYYKYTLGGEISFLKAVKIIVRIKKKYFIDKLYKYFYFFVQAIDNEISRFQTLENTSALFTPTSLLDAIFQTYSALNR